MKSYKSARYFLGSPDQRYLVYFSITLKVFFKLKLLKFFVRVTHFDAQKSSQKEYQDQEPLLYFNVSPKCDIVLENYTQSAQFLTKEDQDYEVGKGQQI